MRPVNQIRPRRRILPFPSGIRGQQGTTETGYPISSPAGRRGVGWSALQSALPSVDAPCVQGTQTPEPELRPLVVSRRGRHRRGTRTAPGYLSSSGDNLCTVITLGRGDGLACRVRARRARDATPATRAVATISFLLMGMMMMGSGQEANTLSKGQVLM